MSVTFYSINDTMDNKVKKVFLYQWFGISLDFKIKGKRKLHIKGNQINQKKFLSGTLLVCFINQYVHREIPC